MKLVYTHPNSMIIGSFASLLNQEGIETEIRNDILGGATGEIAPGETWIELWALNDAEANAAIELIERVQAEPEREDWLCNVCQADNPATFEICWQCQASDNVQGE